MKYLKEYNTDNYYQRVINDIKKDTAMSKEVANMIVDAALKNLNNVNRFEIFFQIGNSCNLNQAKEKIESFTPTYIEMSTTEYNMAIYQKEDEWIHVTLYTKPDSRFHIRADRNEYLCDQMDGLSKFFKDFIFHN